MAFAGLIRVIGESVVITKGGEAADFNGRQPHARRDFASSYLSLHTK